MTEKLSREVLENVRANYLEITEKIARAAEKSGRTPEEITFLAATKTVEPEIIEAGVKTLEKYGTGCSGSRFLNGTLQMHYELEDELKGFLRKEDCITFPTGFTSRALKPSAYGT